MSWDIRVFLHLSLAGLCACIPAGPDKPEPRDSALLEEPACDSADLIEAWTDEDGDGRGAGDPEEYCAGSDGIADQGGDCDDTDAQVNPAATEIIDDGVDEDCDGSELCYRDHDQDGARTDEVVSSTVLTCDSNRAAGADAPLDCDDYDATVYPGAPETCGDGQVNDCDGDTAVAEDQCVWLSGEARLANAIQLRGEDSSGHAGWALSAGGDVNGDGVPDLVVGEPYGEFYEAGHAFVALGPFTGNADLEDISPELYATEYYSNAGMAVAGGTDVDGDGYDDVLVGQPDSGYDGYRSGLIYLEYGPLTGDGPLSDAGARLIGAGSDRAGAALSMGGDADGDGLPDLLIGGDTSVRGDPYSGAVWLSYSPVSGDVVLADLGTCLLGTDDGAHAGASVSLVGDADGDGLADVLIGSPRDATAGTWAGLAALIYAPIPAVLRLTDADVVLYGERIQSQAGTAVDLSGDIDGDGLPELLIGATGDGPSGANQGAGFLLRTPVSGSISLDSADAILRGEQSEDLVGASISGGADLDADGLHDVLVGGWLADGASTNAGAAYLMFGPVSGTIALGSADVKLLGVSQDDEAGTAVAGVQDLDGDGYDELLVGAPLARGRGVAYIASYPWSL